MYQADPITWWVRVSALGTPQDLGEAEVHDLDRGGPRGRRGAAEEDVRRLEVAVDDLLVVGHLERRRGLRDDGADLGAGQVVDPLQARLEVLPFEQLHHDVGHAVGRGVEVNGLDDVGVPQAAGHLGLALEAPLGLGLAEGAVAQQHLDRKAPAEPGVGGLKDGAHAPLADQAFEPVGLLEGLSDQFFSGIHRYAQQSAQRSTAVYHSSVAEGLQVGYAYWRETG